MKKWSLLVVLLLLQLAPAQAAGDTLWATPNPCDTSIDIHLALAINDSVTLTLVNSFGKIIKTFYNKTLIAAGDYTLHYNTDSLPNGIYFLSLNRKTYKRNIKMIKAKGTDVQEWTGDKTLMMVPTVCSGYYTFNRSDVTSVEVYNGQGQYLLKTNVDNQRVNLSALPMGLYYLRGMTRSGEQLPTISLLRSIE